MRRFSILITLAAILVAPLAQAASYTVDPSRLAIRWIAYKTPAKAPVGGGRSRRSRRPASTGPRAWPLL